MKETAFPACSRVLHVEIVRVNECYGKSPNEARLKPLLQRLV